MENNLSYSNNPLYLPAFLKQYGKQVKDFRNVNWQGDISYQLPFLDGVGEEFDHPERVCFPFMGKNCWLWQEEYMLLEPILDRVLELTIQRNSSLGVGPLIPIWDHDKPTDQLVAEGVEDFQQDLISATFRAYAVLTP